MKKRLLALILVLILASSMALIGCSKTEDPTDAPPAETPSETEEESPAEEEDKDDGLSIMYWNIGADPLTIDPVLNGASDGGDVINQTFEGLVREKSGTVYPGIAESWEVSPDGLTVTFYLRESKWSDGSPLTAHDFVYSWKRGMDPATASEYAWIWEYTNVVGSAEAVNGGSLDDVGVKALDDHTLEVKLNTPTDYIVSLLSFYHFLPTKQSSVEAGPDGAWAKDPKLAISNGPFKLTSYKIGEGLSLVKNEHYWNADNVKLDGIEGKFIDETATGYQAYQSGELHFIPPISIPAAEVPRLIAEDPNFYVFPLLGTYYYNFNLDLDMWQDVRVRRALTLAIDRELITETLAAGQVPAAGFVPPGFLDADGKDFFETSGNYGIPTDNSGVEEAKKLLAEAGYPDGKGFPEFTIMYNTNENHKLVAEMIQEMFKTNLGLNTKLENQEWAVFQDTRKAGDYELSRGGWLTDFMDPMGLLSIFTTENAYNDPNYSNPKYDELLSKSALTRGKEHFDLLYEAQDILMTELPIIPVYHYSDMMMASPKLVGWDRSVLGTVDFSGAELLD
ncbi:peptide ABC transporter substrate-binding protein [Alkaliphilus serpentinus]|uniref:Peptide ABC transporter substrate-binding protein n=1 Tax=Alkaliphilus serpentinus TaxID=1482731 RepID=A0A833HML6_9FIRM|nr:peptide ABC transporter substrate-binding protein [Alkaliphilus serpentinus]KAB3527602.1 peptide ABC transporter substrate-binding protein [Alkaliphilus serpentinus]